MTGRALSFGSVASAYERYRLGYPDELVDEVLAHAGRPIRAALEIGAGTGKATRVFAGWGIAVTATDPDATMLAELRNHVPASVAVVQASFEDLSLTRSYDLVFAAASLHWTRPVHRWSRVAALLHAGGVFASFGGQMHLADKAVEEAVCAARSPFLADDGVPSPDGTPEGQPDAVARDRTRSVRPIRDVRQSTIERRCLLATTWATCRRSRPFLNCPSRCGSTCLIGS
jgi:SAM-dependent methyltransferase